MKEVDAVAGKCEEVRLEGLKLYGFGTESMKEKKVCRDCGCIYVSDKKYCDKCGAILPNETLFDLYKARHLYCTACNTVVSNSSIFCPNCGKKLRLRKFSKRV